MNLSVELRDENNPFRLASDIDPVSVLGRGDKSDRIHLYNIGLRFNKRYSLQRIELEANRTFYRYQTFDKLDFNATGYHAAWHWSVTPRLTGVASTSRTETLRDYADFSSFTIRNIQTVERRLLSADWLPGADWHLVGALSESRARNSEAVTALGDDVRDVREAGVRYVSPSENSITLVARQADGRYEGRIADPVILLDNAYDDEEVEARVVWRMTGKSSLNARFGYLERRHDLFSQRDYSGMVGRLGYLWSASAKTSVNVSAGRHLYSFQEFSNSYYVSRDISVVPRWRASEAIALQFKLEHIRRDYRGTIVPVAALREDRIRSVEFGAEWTPLPSALVQAYWDSTRRNSNYSEFDYRARAIGIRARLVF